MTQPGRNFCASPWVELVFGLSGNCTPCCRNSTVLGEWRTSSLREIWHSDAAVRMREEIAAGRFPDAMCGACFSNNTHASLRKLLQKAFFEIVTGLEGDGARGLEDIEALKSILDKTVHDDETRRVLAVFDARVARLESAVPRGAGPLYGVRVGKLRVIRDVVDDFLSCEPRPKRAAPLREPNLIAVCNARCIHCSGAISGDVSRGRRLPDGSHIQQMSFEDVERTLVEEDSILDFFMNGTEILFSKHWRAVADRLSGQGIRLRISTNGMLLTPETSRYLVERGVVGKLNVSLDGATRETVEKIRRRVSYDTVMANLRAFYGQLERLNYPVAVSLSFVLCKDNYRELPDFVRLAAGFGRTAPPTTLAGKLKRWARNLPGLRKKRRFSRPHILIQGMSPYGPARYGAHYRENCHAAIDRGELERSFEEMLAVAERLNVRVIVFYRHELADFVGAGCPFPSIDFITSG